MRAEVHGYFNVRLCTPIVVGTGIGADTYGSLRAGVGDGCVLITPIASSTAAEASEFPEAPDASLLAVLIKRTADLIESPGGLTRLDPGDKNVFEAILLESVTRLLTSLKLQAGQWYLDSRHPIHSFRYRYVDQRGQLLEQGHSPGSQSREGLTFGYLLPSVAADAWNALSGAMDEPTRLPMYFELLCEAKVLRTAVRYNDSLLYAMIACELLLEEFIAARLSTSPSLRAAIPTSWKDDSGKRLVTYAHRLAPHLGIDHLPLADLFDQRNKVAHGDPVRFGPPDADRAIHAAEVLQQIRGGMPRL